MEAYINQFRKTGVVKEVVNVFLIFLCPPLAVYLERFPVSPFSFWLNLTLTLFFCIPGIVHAVFIFYIHTDISPEQKKVSCDDQRKNSPAGRKDSTLSRNDVPITVQGEIKTKMPIPHTLKTAPKDTDKSTITSVDKKNV